MPDTQDTLFLRPIFEGERYNGGRLPLEALAELRIYREIIVELARALFLERTGRKNVPKGWEKNFKLELTELKDGSAEIALSRPHEHSFPPPVSGRRRKLELVQPYSGEQDEFEAARDWFNNYLNWKNGRSTKQVEIPKSAAVLFGSFGKTLQETEQLKLVRPGESRETATTYTPSLRHRIIRDELATYRDTFDGRGIVFAADSRRGTFKFRSDDGLVFEAHTPMRLRRVVPQAFALNLHTRVRLKAHVTFDANEQIVGVDAIIDFQLEPTIDEAVVESIEQRFEWLKELPAGWAEGEGISLSEEGLGWFREFIFGIMSDFGIPAPHLFPTPEGGIQAEWAISDWRLSVTFELEERQAEMFAVNLSSDASDVQQLDLGLPGEKGKQQFAEWVMKFRDGGEA